jgi:hypothetical protein
VNPGASNVTVTGFRSFGGAFINKAIKPDKTNSHTISDSVQAVVNAKTPKRTHER